MGHVDDGTTNTTDAPEPQPADQPVEDPGSVAEVEAPAQGDAAEGDDRQV